MNFQDGCKVDSSCCLTDEETKSQNGGVLTSNALTLKNEKVQFETLLAQ